jgi:DNA-binding CsgD family transcriptional regulator
MATQAREEALTRREVEVLKWFHAGYPPADIATLLGLSLHTVRSYFKEIRRKYGVPSAALALAAAEAEGLFSQEASDGAGPAT